MLISKVDRNDKLFQEQSLNLLALSQNSLMNLASVASNMAGQGDGIIAPHEQRLAGYRIVNNTVNVIEANGSRTIRQGGSDVSFYECVGGASPASSCAFVCA
jgi:hypothetical protein